MNAITVENVSKRYLIDHQARADTLRDALTQGVRGLWGRLRQGRLKKEDFWALRDINLEVKSGEVLGIIGRNGAGKSTLLKILSRITEPTTGRIQIRGRVASLLEVGTGFHPELSGRENIFLNGAILGMSRVEITRKFDEIVAFAEVERFLDTPVKRYSSGMYVRLAFAVAAHLEPEILIVDEVLAVGDAQFQRKCLGKMQDVARNSGRTVLLVSHNLGQVRSLCDRAVFLRNGTLAYSGTANDALTRYQADDQHHEREPILQAPLASIIRLQAMRLLGSSAGPIQCIRTDSVQLEFTLQLPKPISQLRITIAVFADGVRLCTFHETDPFGFTAAPAGNLSVTCRLPVNQLQPGSFQIGLGFCDGHPSRYAWNSSAFSFEVLEDEQHRGPRDSRGFVILPFEIIRRPAPK